MSLAKNFRELYIVPDDIGEEWYNKVFELGKKDDCEELEKHLNTAKEFYFVEARIISALITFTKKTEASKEKIRLLKGLKEEECIKNVEIGEFNVIIEGDNFKVEAFKLSDCILDLKKDKDIETDAREGQCHEKSIEISLKLGWDNEVVTGYTYEIADKTKFLHSWIEYKNKIGEEFVIDYTKNLVINKEGYYYITHAEPLSRISRENLINDDKILNNQLAKIGPPNVKEYLVFRDELLRDVNKNREIFDDEER